MLSEANKKELMQVVRAKHIPYAQTIDYSGMLSRERFDGLTTVATGKRWQVVSTDPLEFVEVVSAVTQRSVRHLRGALKNNVVALFEKHDQDARCFDDRGNEIYVRVSKSGEILFESKAQIELNRIKHADDISGLTTYRNMLVDSELSGSTYEDKRKAMRSIRIIKADLMKLTALSYEGEQEDKRLAAIDRYNDKLKQLRT